MTQRLDAAQHNADAWRKRAAEDTASLELLRLSDDNAMLAAKLARLEAELKDYERQARTKWQSVWVI